MTVGIGFLNRKGSLVLAADSRETGDKPREDAQKVFALGNNSGVAISGCSPFDSPDSIDLPITEAAKRIKETVLDTDARRQTVLRILAESIRTYLHRSAQEYPDKPCQIATIRVFHNSQPDRFAP